MPIEEEMQDTRRIIGDRTDCGSTPRHDTVAVEELEYVPGPADRSHHANAATGFGQDGCVDSRPVNLGPAGRPPRIFCIIPPPVGDAQGGGE